MSKVTQWIDDNSTHLVKCDCGHWSEVVGCSLDDRILCSCCEDIEKARINAEQRAIREVQTALAIMLKRVTTLLPREG